LQFGCPIDEVGKNINTDEIKKELEKVKEELERTKEELKKTKKTVSV
jgi:predicted ATP-grasp superfamily ATP-dependent carboligase